MIFLDETQNEHKLLIEAIEKSDMKAWTKKSLISRIQDDIDNKEKRQICEHSFKEYTGHKESCTKCGQLSNKPFNWKLNSFIDEGLGEQTTHHSKEIGNTAL